MTLNIKCESSLHGELDIPDDNPFQNDKLNREMIADNLEKIIDTKNESFVLSIDSCWGNGKTTFIKMWKQKLDNSEKYTTLYFNAWENDDCEDPLLAMISELEEVIVKDKENNTTLDKIKRYGKPLLKKSLSTILKIATNNLIDIENIKQNVSDSTEKHLVDFAGKLGEFELYKEAKESKIKFKEALKEYQISEGRKIIFFIDELDRCRPTFAIETLEKIKHLFNINDFIFVLALDKQQLSHSIKTLYGQDMDSVGYLRRFIDIEFMLPEPDRKVYTDILLERYNLKNSNTKYFERYLTAAIENYNLSLRDIEKLFYYLVLLIPSTPLGDKDTRYKQIYLEVLGVIYAIFTVIKIKKVELYQKIVNRGAISGGDFAGVFNFENQKQLRNYSPIMSNIVSINNRLRQMGEAGFVVEEYIIGEDDFDGNYFPMIKLLDESNTVFLFIKEMEFVDNFVIPDKN